VDWTTARLCEGGVDWATGVTLELKASTALMNWTRKIYKRELRAGGIEKSWGCSGFTGFKCGEIEFGRRDDELMVRVMSELALKEWASLYVWADRITRIDLQLTFDVGCDPQPLIWSFFHDASRRSREKGGVTKNNVILGSDGSATLYCGTRWSNVFGRAYARGPKTKRPEDRSMLRFEVQYNKRLAMRVARQLAFSRTKDDWIHARVVQFFGRRGVFIPARFDVSVNDSLSRNRSDCDKRLLWLEKSVRPSCVMLAERGLLKQLVANLGLSNYVDVKPTKRK